jgi:hypothetical protein
VVGSFQQPSRGQAVENSPGPLFNVEAKQASRCYEQRQQASDAFEKSLEQRDALCFQNEHSEAVWTRLHYKPFAETKLACGKSCEGGYWNMSEEVRHSSESEFAALVAIDWADKKHVWRLEVIGTGQRERGELEHTPEAIEAWASHLGERFSGRAIAVGLEQSRGSLLYVLTKYAHLGAVPDPPHHAGQVSCSAVPIGRQG